MGRRPNGLVTEFFERGEKLQNHSNRYRHTCKKCGEVFPKGRVHTLTTHLIQQCPNINNKDRGRIVEQIKLSPSRSLSAGAEVLPGLRRPYQSEDILNYDKLRQQQSALDTLAEVSRRHLNYSTQTGVEVNGQRSDDQSTSQNLAERTFVEQLQQFAGSPFPASQASLTATTSSDHHNLFLVTTADAVPPTSAFVTSGLVQTASEANQHLASFQQPLESHPNRPDSIDPHLDVMGGQLQTQTLTQSINESDGPVRRELDGIHDYARMSPGEAYSSRQPPKPSPKKVRGQFSDGRRKEVANVRKTGACLRCRVLKKPCSGDTPCNSCSSIATARIWKDSCTRTRLVDELTLYSTQLFYARSSLEVSACGYGFERAVMPGRIEARLFTTTDLTVYFSVRGFLRNVDPSNQVVDTAFVTNGQAHLLIDDAYRAPERIGLYARRSVDMFKESEGSQFMKSTVEEVVALVAAEESEGVAGDKELNRIKHPQQRLPDNVLELWALTRLLSKLDHYPVELRYNSVGSADLEPERFTWQDDEEVESSFRIPPATLSYKLIRGQLLANIETRCRRLSSDITNELERRLLQRRESSQFTTLICGVVLLNCIERMTGFYASNDLDQTGPVSKEGISAEDHPRDVHTEAVLPQVNSTPDSTSEPTTAQPNWPIDTPPSTIWRQGPPFAALLIMLLRLRNLPPRLGQTERGTLAVIQSDINFHNGKAVAPHQQHTALINAVGNWLNPLELGVAKLMAKRYADIPTRAEGVEAWDMVFISKVLLDERMGSS